MPRVTFALNDELFQGVAGYASQEAMEVDDFLSREIQQRAAQLLPAARKAWMPREQWDALVEGTVPVMCRNNFPGACQSGIQSMQRW